MTADCDDYARLFGKLVMRADGCWHFLMNGEVVFGNAAKIEWVGRVQKVRGVLLRMRRPRRRHACANRHCVRPSHLPISGRPKSGKVWPVASECVLVKTTRTR